MRIGLLLAALIGPLAPAHADPASTYKLVITWYQAGIVVIDYPTKARCEAAHDAVKNAIAQRQAAVGMNPITADVAFCIPG